MSEKVRILSMFCVIAGLSVHPAFGQETGDLDRFGCEIQPRPEHFEYTTFRDSWRSLAARDLYTLRRYEATIEAGECDCAVFRPSWSTIETEFEELGFSTGTRSDYSDWGSTVYHPHIEGLRRQVTELCKDPVS